MKISAMFRSFISIRLWTPTGVRDAFREVRYQTMSLESFSRWRLESVGLARRINNRIKYNLFYISLKSKYILILISCFPILTY